MTVIKMSSSPDCTGKETNNSPESAGKKKYINFFTDAVFIFGISNALITAVTSIAMLGALIYDVVVEVNNNMEPLPPLPTDRRCVIMLSALHIVAFLFTVDLLSNVGKVQRRRLIWTTIVTMMVTLAGMTTTFVYLAFVGLIVEIFWISVCIIYSLLLLMVLLGLVYTEPRTDQEHKTVEPSGFGEINKLMLVQNIEQSKKSGLEII